MAVALLKKYVPLAAFVLLAAMVLAAAIVVYIPMATLR
jgi:hypothetical protein